MRYLFLASYAPSLVSFRGQLIQDLLQRGHDVTAIAPGLDTSTFRANPCLTGCQLFDFRILRGSLPSLRDLWACLALFFRLYRLRPNVLIAYTIKPVVYAGLVVGLYNLLNTRTPIKYFPLITGLGFAFTDGDKTLYRNLLRLAVGTPLGFCLRNSTSVIFQNADDLNLFRESGYISPSASVFVVPGSGVDTEFFSPAPLPDSPTFLMLSRLVTDKGVREFCLAASEVRKSFPEAVFQIGGSFDTNSSSLTEHQFLTLCSSNQIIYLGDLRDVRPSIGASRYFVLPSYREGLPRSTLEALSMGRPVITTDVPGCRETVQHGFNGFLVQPRSYHSLAKGMTQLLSLSPDAQVDMGRASRYLAITRFNVRHVNSLMIDILTS